MPQLEAGGKASLSVDVTGATFPTVWSIILKGHPLVAGLPTNTVKEGLIILEVLPDGGPPEAAPNSSANPTRDGGDGSVI